MGQIKQYEDENNTLLTPKMMNQYDYDLIQ